MSSSRDNRKGRLLWAIFALGLAASVAARAEAGGELLYRWHLGGYKGLLARLVMPGTGDAVLRTTELDSGLRRRELLITSPNGRSGEYWHYGSLSRGDGCGRVVSVWTEQLFRGRTREKRAEIDEEGVLDIPTCICRIRRDPPPGPVETRIWSEGRIYPISISGPQPDEARFGGRTVAVDTYSVSGLRRGEERHWKGRLVLVVARDAARTPLEIRLEQPGISVRLELAEEP